MANAIDHGSINQEAQRSFTSADKAAVQKYMSLDTPERMQHERELLLEKWSGKRAGKYNSSSDWLGQGAVDRGFPKVEEKHWPGLAMILENQLRYNNSKEMRVGAGGRIINQDTQVSDEALPTKFALPIVRRVYAIMTKNDWSVIQPIPAPTSYVFWLDFIRENDNSNIISVEYDAFQTGELAVPKKGKLSLQRAQITVVKQLIGMAWSLEALEDGRALLGIDVEQELLAAFGTEIVRNLFARHLKDINLAAVSGTGTGTGLTSPWSGPNTQHTIAAQGGTSLTDYKSVIYNTLIDADTDYQRANRRPSNGIVAGYGLAGLLRKMLTATGVSEPDEMNNLGAGIVNYGVYDNRWTIWGTDFLPDDQGFLYTRNPDQLQAAHVYAPYIPVQVMPAIYGDYDSSTGAYSNKDAWTRNIRERSADIVTKPYGFQPIKAAAF